MATLKSRSVRRREDVRLLTGRGRYAADQHPPGMLQAVLVRSPHAHASIGDIDVAAALAMPGVVAVFTAADLTDVSPIPAASVFRALMAARHRRPTGRCWRPIACVSWASRLRWCWRKRWTPARTPLKR